MMLDDRMTTSDLFAPRARDWTPPAARDAARVVYAPVSRDAEFMRRCASVLSPAELAQADRFLATEAKARFLERRAFRRYCAARAIGAARPMQKIEFEESGKGRPYLLQAPDLSFSFSSCRLGYVGAWSSSHDVGVDIEDQTRTVEALELAQRYFSRAEALMVERAGGADIFFALWTMKEAALKSIGEGLPFGLDAFEFELGPRPRIVRAPQNLGGAERFHAHLVGHDNHCAALVTAERR